MQVHFKILEDNAAMTFPASPLENVEMPVGQSLEQQGNGHILTREPSIESLEYVLPKVTQENLHILILEGTKMGAEAW